MDYRIEGFVHKNILVVEDVGMSLILFSSNA